MDAKHRRRNQDRKQRAKKRLERARETGDFSILEGRETGEDKSRLIDENDFAGKMARGPMYAEFVASGLAAEVWHNRINQTKAADRFGTGKMNVSRWMKAYAVDVAKDAARRERAQADEDWSELFSDLVAFTRQFFPKLLVPEFHTEWVEAIDRTVDKGGRLLLLAPQRHGKSEMLIRYCLMRICRDPNVRILWVSKTEDLAKKMVGYVRQVLEHHHELREAAIGPDEWVPPKGSGLSWTSKEFTVANRTDIAKSATMTALGVGGTIVGLDADLIILDDPQDRKRCMSPTQRTQDVEWMFTDFVSRKEEDTGLAFIMSRQHIEDLPGHVIKEHIDDWEVKVYRAHDPACTIPDKDLDGHTDCVLWPEKRSWRYLEAQKRGNLAHFSRNYMNDPRDDATTYITADDIAEIKDRTRRVGDVPSGCRLIGGIDPAEAKAVAAVLWGFDGLHRHVIDCMEAPASVVGLRKILTDWPARYGVREFAFEKNMAQGWLIDTEVKRLIDEQRLKIHHHYTSRVNKQSNEIGPISMFQRMRTAPPEITIPAAPGEGLDRIDRLVQSWITFDPDWAGHKHADDDLTMASWFPQLIIDAWNRPKSTTMTVDYSPIGMI